MKIKDAVCFSFDLTSQNSLAYLRLIGPLRQLGINIINGNENDQTEVDKVLDGDIVIIQRNFPRKYNDYLQIVEIARRAGKPVVFDMDDLLFAIPENHPYRQTDDYTTSLLPMVQAIRDADLVTVSTQGLSRVLKEYNEHIVVLPNYLDDALWKLAPPQSRSKNEPVRIGYMGTASHKPDLEYITPVLADIVKRYPGRISFLFWGIEPPQEIRNCSQLIPITTTSMNNEYKEFAGFFQTQLADIFIAPLVKNLFNRCKSSVKFLEYSALGAPGIYSSIEAYSEIVNHGKNGLLASSPEDWSECLMLLIENDELRTDLALDAQLTIQENWLLSRNAYRWQEAFDHIEIHKALKMIPAEADLIQSINTQTVRYFKKSTDQIAKLEQSIQQLEIQLESSKAEANAYLQSTSWKITKPLRMIQEFSSISQKIVI